MYFETKENANIDGYSAHKKTPSDMKLQQRYLIFFPFPLPSMDPAQPKKSHKGKGSEA